MKRKRSTTEFDLEEFLRPSKRPRLEDSKHQPNSPQSYLSLSSLRCADLQPNSPQSYDDLLSIVQTDDQPISPQSYPELLGIVQTDHQPNSPQSYPELLSIIQNDHQPYSPQSYPELLSIIQTDHQPYSPQSYPELLSFTQTDHQLTYNPSPPDSCLLSLTQTDHQSNFPKSYIDLQSQAKTGQQPMPPQSNIHLLSPAKTNLQPNPPQSYTNLPGLTHAFSCNKNHEGRLSYEKPPSPRQDVTELQQSAYSNQTGDVEEHALAQTAYISTPPSPFDSSALGGAKQFPVSGEGLSPSGPATGADLPYSEPKQNILHSVKTGSSILRKERLSPDTVCLTQYAHESDSPGKQASRKRKLSCTSNVPGEPSPKKRKEQSCTPDNLPGEPTPKKRKELLREKIQKERQRTRTSPIAQTHGNPPRSQVSQSSSFSPTANWRKQLNDWNEKYHEIDSKDAHKMKYPSHLHEWLERVKFNHTKTWTMFRYVEPRWTAKQIALTSKFKYSSRA